MTARIWRYIFHRHEFTEYVGRTCQGATLGWGGDVVPCYAITDRCWCGKERTQRGMILPLVKFPKDADGWPLDDQGKRMRIARLAVAKSEPIPCAPRGNIVAAFPTTPPPPKPGR